MWENIKVRLHLGVAWGDPVVTAKDALGGQVYSGLSPVQPSHGLVPPYLFSSYFPGVERGVLILQGTP